MGIYYQDEHVTLHHGDSLEILPSLDIEARALLTDPPYFKVKNEPWDNQWKKPEHFLKWLGDFLDTAKPLIAANGSVWVFASPKMSARVELLVGERFNVLNNIRWWKPNGGTARRVSMPTMRSFASVWESIIFAEQYHDSYEDMSTATARKVFAPLGDYLRGKWESAGWRGGELGIALGRDSALPTRWAEGSSIPSEGDYQKMKELIGGRWKEHSEIRAWRDDLRREFEHLRRPFSVDSIPLKEDIWRFNLVGYYPGKHPCEKPQDMLQHMIRTTTREGDTVLDPFAGSGSTLIAAKALGRKSVGIEMNEQYCEQIATRLTQQPEQLAFEFTA